MRGICKAETATNRSCLNDSVLITSGSAFELLKGQNYHLTAAIVLIHAYLSRFE